MGRKEIIVKVSVTIIRGCPYRYYNILEDFVQHWKIWYNIDIKKSGE